MAYVDWMIKGLEIASCSCSYGCPCEFDARPTNDVCEGFETHRIDEGDVDDIRLDGTVFAARYQSHGPVHEGGGVVRGAIDSSASRDQIDALFEILGAEEQKPTTGFDIYGSTIGKQLDPIRNPITGANHSTQIRLLSGFEFREAEMASGRFTAQGPDLEFDYVAYGPRSVIS